MIDRLRSLFRNHGEATAMLGGGAAILVVIVIGTLVLQSAMLPTGRRTPASVPTTPSPNASFAVAYPSPSVSLPASTPRALQIPIDEEGGYLESPDLDAPTATPDATATPTAKPTPKPTATPRPTHTPAPASVGTLALVVRDASNGSERHLFPIRKGDSVEAVVELIAPDFDRSRCSLVQVLEPDDPAIAARDVALEPLATQTVDPSMAGTASTRPATTPSDPSTSACARSRMMVSPRRARTSSSSAMTSA
jgi:hypothetical protein